MPCQVDLRGNVVAAEVLSSLTHAAAAVATAVSHQAATFAGIAKYSRRHQASDERPRGQQRAAPAALAAGRAMGLGACT